MTSSQPGSARYYFNLRLIAVAIIAFLSGHQLKSIQYLFRSTIITNDDGAWTPAEIKGPNIVSRGERNGEHESNTIADISRYNDDDDDDDDNNEVVAKEREKQKMRRAKRPPSRYDASNYPDFQLLPWSLPRPTPLRYLTSEKFMVKYIAKKRKYSIALPWEEYDKYEDKNVSLPLPIIALNFPKSATTTLSKFFDCGGLTSIHTSTQDGRIGLCMMDNHLNDNLALDGCNTVRTLEEEYPIECYSDIGFVGLRGPPCYYASLHDGGLENIVKHYPKATILLITRNATAWTRSMARWANIRTRWTKICGFDGRLLPHESVQRENMVYWNTMLNQTRNNEEEYWVNFYNAHTQKIREFAMDHLSLTYVEVELENENIGTILQQYTKVSPDCLMECHPGKWMIQNNATSQCHPIGQNPARVTNKHRTVPEEEDSDNVNKNEINSKNADTVDNDGEAILTDDTERGDNDMD